MGGPTRDEAAAALDELAAGRRATAAAEIRGLPVLLGAWSLLVFVDYAAKDHVADRRVRWLVTALCQAATLGLGLLDNRSRPVQPISPDPVEVGPRAVVPMVGAAVGWALAERVIVLGLRRSRLSRPNTLAGLVLAVGRPIGYVGMLRLTPRPKSDD
jgi:hypothetical protein